MPQLSNATLDSSSALIVFDTDRTPPGGRLDAWNGAFGSLNAITIATESGGEPSSRSENWLLGGGLIVSQTRVTPSHFLRDAARTRRDSLDHLVLRVLRSGRGHLRHAGFDATTEPGDLVLFSMHETWSVEWDDAEWVSLCIPRDLDLRLTAGLAALPSGLLRGAGAGLIADMMLALPARAAAARADELPILARTVHAAIGACLLSGVSPSAASPADAAIGLAKERVRRAILRNIGSARLTPGQLAIAAGVSRSALYRLYEAEGGVARYIQQVRLSLAHAALRDPQQTDKSISAIAEAHGFPTPSDFSRAFRAAYGTAPSEVRAALAAGPAMPVVARSRRPHFTGRRDLASIIYALPSSR
ncbi:MAG: helix-turn-helix transcriptional regulator [Burkholderiales bacterium]|nr:helix-turn-helix transcriptional regulator [Burkholderiales bacterium]